MRPAGSGRSTTRLGRRVLGAAAAVGLGTVAYAALVEPRWFALRHVTVPVLAPDGAGVLRVLHLSDLHRWGRARELDAFVARCWTLAPDLIVLTGDVLGGEDVAGAVAALRDPPAPAVAVLGSNDRYGPTWKNPLAYLIERARGARRERDHGTVLDTAGLVAGLRAGGWSVPINARTSLTTRAGVVEILALDDPHIGRDRPALLDQGTPEADPVVRLGLVHAPYRRSLDALDARGCALTLAGHTHGGQVRVPLVGALVTNCDLPPRAARGLSGDDEGGWLHVSAGLGVARTAPLRLGCRPEATLVDLVTRPHGRVLEA